MVCILIIDIVIKFIKGSYGLKRFTRFFTVILLLLFSGLMFFTIYFGKVSVGGAIKSSLYYALVIMGVPVTFRYFPRTMSRMKDKFWFFGLLIAVFILYGLSIVPTLLYAELEKSVNIGTLLIAISLLATKYMILNLLLSFSIAYFIYAFTATYAPVILNNLVGLTKRGYGKEGFFKWGWIRFAVLGWIFNIPGFIDTHRLHLRIGSTKVNMGKKLLALLPIEVFLASLLVLYIGLNPFPPDLSRVILIDVSLNIASLIPIVVFPVYILYMLKPFIPTDEESKRGFWVHKGMKNRLTGLMITVTTILLILRLAFERLSSSIFILAGLKLLIAIPGLLLSTIIFILVFERMILFHTTYNFRRGKGGDSSFLGETERIFKEWISGPKKKNKIKDKNE